MATIKLQNGKVITKSGKVSCTCCGGDGGGCCLYPGDGLYVGAYTGNDLPDFIEVSTIDDVFWEFGKIGIEYYNTVPVFDPSRINPNTFPPGEVRVVTFDTGDPLGPPDYKYHWVLQYREGSTWFFVDDADSDACLVREKGGWIIKDQFADTYTITYSYEEDPTLESGSGIITTGYATVNRESLCAWGGVDSICNRTVYLYYSYNDNYLFSENKFRIAFDTCRTALRSWNLEKSGFQNTPSGNYIYPGPVGLFAEATVT